MAAPVRRRRRAKVRPVESAGTAAPGAEYQSKAIDRALTVLECFPASDTTLSLSELATLSGFPESSLFRVLVTLEGRGYLLRNADGSYRLAPRCCTGRSTSAPKRPACRCIRCSTS